MTFPRALWRVAVGHAVHRPLQSGLLVLGVALGVAVVVAIDIANASAVAAFQLSTDAVAGRATHRVVGGPQGLDEALYPKVRQALGWRDAAPVVEGTVALRATGADGRVDSGDVLTLLGIDPFAEPPFRSYLGDGSGAGASDSGPSASPSGRDDAAFAALLTRPGAVLLAEDTARRAGLAVGQGFALVTSVGPVTVTLAGLLRPADDLGRRALAGLVLADISTAQEVLAKVGRLDRIDLSLAPGEAAVQAGGEELPSEATREPGTASSTHEPSRASESAEPGLPHRDADRGSNGDRPVREIVRRVEAVLPPGAAVVPAGESQAALDGMTRAFRLNLTALSLLALLVGLLLIYNTMRFSVVQRRAVLATLRSLGVTPGEVVGMVLIESLVLGLVGTLAGLVLGVVLGRAMVALVTRTVSDLFFTLTVRGVPLPLASLVRGAVLGVAATTAAAWLPAREAAGVLPALGRQRSGIEAAARLQAPKAFAAAFLAAGLAWALLAIPGNRVDLGFAALAAVVAAYALVAPVFTMALMRLMSPLAARLGGTVGRMAPRNVTRSLSRTAVAVAALMVAVCVSIGVSLMVGSFRRTVDVWLGETLTADVFITTQPDVGERQATALDAATIRQLTTRPEVADWATTYQRPLRAEPMGLVETMVVSRDIAATTRRYLATNGPPPTLWSQLEAGAVLITEPFSRFNALGVGDHLTLRSDHGLLRMPIIGVYYDYSSTRGKVLMAQRVYRANWDDQGLTSLALFLKPGVSADDFAAQLKREQLSRGPLGERGALGQATPNGAASTPQAAPAGATPAAQSGLPDQLRAGHLAIESTAGVRREVFKVFDRAFSITVALQLLAIIVAFVGILSALFALQLERTRELATLRTLGLTNGQLTVLSLTETGAMGLAAGLLSWPAGLTLALILIYVVNRRSFGWTIQFTFLPDVFVKALLLAVGAALVAGLLPALRLRSLVLARALREE